MLSKNESLQFKGVAILIMVFLHLFINGSNVSLCHTVLYFQNEPIVLQISKFTGFCAGLYLFLSGYGLYISNQNHSSVSPCQRILKLYLNFWVVFVIFISLGAYLKPQHYPGSFWEILSNFTGWHTTYNGEWWFLFPYILLVLTSKIIFKYVRRYSTTVLLLLIGGGFILTYLTIYINREYLYSHQLVYMPLLYFNCLVSFALGALFAKEDWFQVLKEKIQIKNAWMNILWLLLLVALIALRALSPISAVNIIFMLLFIAWFALVRKSRWVVWLLEKLGKQSTNMWLVHTFFCYYLFHDWIYGFKYPIVILAVTVILSYCSGVIIDLINHPLQKAVIGKIFKK